MLRCTTRLAAAHNEAFPASFVPTKTSVSLWLGCHNARTPRIAATLWQGSNVSWLQHGDAATGLWPMGNVARAQQRRGKAATPRRLARVLHGATKQRNPPIARRSD